ncbi:hypothetical protein R3P38DRAFT_2853031 [Favolaschia claudopus]|uniref:Uncharacterized protein n=1 Tax=Favolaschia claudopus TaxID=2862362 RepID=A0AAW0DMA9_9AGAR
MSSNYVYNIAPSRFQPGSRSALPAAAPQAPTVARKQRVKKRNLGMSARLPEGYAFVPPANPLVFPSTYHLIEAGPMHERPRRKRSVLGVLTNAVRPKRKEPRVIDPVTKVAGFSSTGDTHGGGAKLLVGNWILVIQLAVALDCWSASLAYLFARTRFDPLPGSVSLGFLFSFVSRNYLHVMSWLRGSQGRAKGQLKPSPTGLYPATSLQWAGD